MEILKWDDANKKEVCLKSKSCDLETCAHVQEKEIDFILSGFAMRFLFMLLKGLFVVIRY